MPAEPRLEAGGRIVRVSLADGSQARFHAIWLRDNVLDASTRDPGNGQRLITVNDIPVDTRVKACRIDGDHLEATFQPGEQIARFPLSWLSGHRYDTDTVENLLPETSTCWNGELAPGHHDFELMLTDDGARATYLDDLTRYGVAIIANSPTDPGTVTRIAELAGPVRETNYGRLFDVRAEPDPINLAYSGLGLQAHTDNPYRDPAPTVQILHCLENTVDGGETSLVDGYAAALRLRHENRPAFDILSRHNARFRFSGDPHEDLQSRRPMIQLGPDGAILAIRFNNRSAAPLVDVPFDEMEDYYAAWRGFAAIIDDPAMAIQFRLAPGMAFAVDNRRVLHARTAFSTGGKRWLQGCYADMDAVTSRWRVLSRAVSR